MSLFPSYGVQWVNMKGHCTLCWYWRNRWQYNNKVNDHVTSNQTTLYRFWQLLCYNFVSNYIMITWCIHVQSYSDLQIMTTAMLQCCLKLYKDHVIYPCPIIKRFTDYDNCMLQYSLKLYKDHVMYLCQIIKRFTNHYNCYVTNLAQIYYIKITWCIHAQSYSALQIMTTAMLQCCLKLLIPRNSPHSKPVRVILLELQLINKPWKPVMRITDHNFWQIKIIT